MRTLDRHKAGLKLLLEAWLSAFVIFVATYLIMLLIDILGKDHLCIIIAICLPFFGSIGIYLSGYSRRGL